MTPKNKDKFGIPTEVEKNENSIKLVEVINIKDTPFSVVKLEDQNCFIAIGNDRITEIITTDEATTMINEKDWRLITSLITIVNFKKNTNQ